MRDWAFSELIQRLLGRGVLDGLDGVGEVSERRLRGVADELRRASRLERTDEDLAQVFSPIDAELRAVQPPTRVRNGDDTPLLVADEIDRIHSSGAKATWASFFRPDIPMRKFEAWAHAPSEGPLPPLDPNSGLSCWEMFLWAAARKKVITHAELHELYAPLRGRVVRSELPPRDWARRVGQALLPPDRQNYVLRDPASPLPKRGDLIMWGDNAHHVVMATGHLGNDSSPEVYSFWMHPNDLLTRDEITRSSTTVIDAIKISTINELHSYVVEPGDPELAIWFGRGPW